MRAGGRLERVLRAGLFAVTAELNPPDSADPQAVYDWLDSLKQLRHPPELVRMPDTSHFFHRKLIDLRGAIKHGVRPFLPRAT